MTVLFDTNVLIYAARTEAPEHAVCMPLLEGWRAGNARWHVTWSVLYEFLRAVTHAGAVRSPLALAEAWSFVDGLLAAPSLRVLEHTPEHARVIGNLLREEPRLRDNAVHDAHIAALMLEHGVRTIYTRDRDFRRFPFLEVIDPLQA